MHKRHALQRAIMLASICLLLQACAGSPPARFYVLNAVCRSADAAGMEQRSVAVGPVRLPEYLDRSQIATRTSSEIVDFAEFDRWAESLDKNFARVLADNLSTLLATDRVSLFPFSGFRKQDYQVVVDVVRFDGARGGKAFLSARYSIYSKDEKEPLTVKKADYTEVVSGDSFEALVAAHCQNLGSLSREIASTIKSF